MKRLMICFVLLVALFVYAVPTESDVGDGYSVAIDESGDALILIAQFEWTEISLMPANDGGDLFLYSYLRQMEEEGYLAGRVVPPDIANKSLAISFNAKATRTQLYAKGAGKSTNT